MAEYKDGKLQLKNVTLVAMTSVNIQATIKALKYSMKDIDFGAVKLITHRRPRFMTRKIKFSKTTKLTNIDDFNYKMFYELGSHIDTEFALIVHADGFVVHPEKWQDEFLDYDYIGSPWPIPKEDDLISYRDKDNNLCRVGNSAGIRSKKLMDYPLEANIPWEGVLQDGIVWYNEDVLICCKYRHLFEEAGMSIAPLEVAKYYSHENMVPEVEGITPFAFHKWYGTNKDYPNFQETKLICKLEHFHFRALRKLKRIFKKKQN
ncbi:MAG: hypothetical protein MJ133_00240 [Lachnospiraceae bacterium]|nr:hypothetical protein [Lachnospiraceae bacterium]